MAQDQPSLDFQSHVDEAYEILKRLSVKDLCQKSLVSGTWRNLIQDDDFKTLHHSWFRKNPLLLIIVTPQLVIQNYLSSDDEYQQVEDLCEDFEIVNENDTEFPLVLTSVNPTDGEVMYRLTIPINCDDFEVLSSGRGSLFCIRSSVNYSIFNPTTKQIHTLPQADPPNAIVSGFGYIESEKTYVIVKLLYSLCQIIMLSETGHMITPWKTIEDAVPFNASGNPGFIVGKACYWLDDQTLRLPMMMRILCLDLDSETFYIVDYPAPESYENKHDMRIGELKGKLFMTDTFPNMLKMDIWERKNGKYSNWEMKYCIDLSLIDGFDDVFSELKLIGYISEGDQDEMLMFQNSEENEVFYYDVEAKTFKEGHQLEVGNSIDSMIFPYTEKFSSIRRPAERID